VRSKWPSDVATQGVRRPRDDRKGTRKVAEAYLPYLYSPEGLEIAARNFYRPTDPKVAARYDKQFPKLTGVTIDAAFGGWPNATRTHFADGAIFDQIYTGDDAPTRLPHWGPVRLGAAGRRTEVTGNDHALRVARAFAFWRITLPNVKWGLLYGVILCNARAMGEFGAVSVVSGHIRGVTNTLPLHVEILYSEYQFAAVFACASLLALLALVTLGLKEFVEGKHHEHRAA
jgi:hypothetical protein